MKSDEIKTLLAPAKDGAPFVSKDLIVTIQEWADEVIEIGPGGKSRLYFLEKSIKLFQQKCWGSASPDALLNE